MKIIALFIALLMPISTFALDLINNFEWLEPNKKVEVVVGESYQLKFNCSDNSLPFTSDYADNWNHYDFDGGQHMVSTPTGYSINEKGVITGLVPGSYAIKFTGYIQPKSGVDKMLMITVVSERSEVESNNTLDTANEITSKIRFGLYNTSDIDYFKYSNSSLKWGDEVTFKIHYYGTREEPFGYKWSTFCGTSMSGSGSLLSQDQECRALVSSGNTVYLEVYYDQSRSQYFNYGEEFVAEVYINGIPTSDIESGTCGDNLTWSYSKSTKTLTISGTGNMWDYDYDYFSGKSSTPWYEFSENIQNVTIHDGVTTIGNCAFYGCYNMESIDIPNSIINIGNWSFMYCRSLSNIEMPDNVVCIGAQAFYLCRGLKTIKISNGITTIGNWAFGSCESLEFIEIPDNVKTIGGEAFRNCSKLTTVTIPKNVSSIGDMSFGFCASLSALIVEEGNSVYDSRNNCNAIIETATNELIQGCNGTTIPKGITKIKSHAFIGSGISSVTIPNSITTISYEAFKYCNELTTVVVGSGITTIGESNVGYSFGSCPKLRDFYIYPNNIPTTLDRTFDETSLDNVILHVPANLVDVYKSTAPWSGFKEIVALTDSDPKPEGNTQSDDGREPYAVLSDYNTILTFYYDNQKEMRGGMSVGPFEDTADRGWNGASETITSVIFDASFAACTSLTSTAYWFNGMKNLTSITGLNNLKTENVTGMMLMFYGCSSLTSLDLSNFNTSNVMVMSDMFFECSSLTSLDLSSFNTSNVTSMSGVFYNCSSLTNLDLSGFNTSKVTDMRYMFSGCSSLTTIVVGDGWSTARVTDSDYMFSRCTKLVGGKGTTYDANHTDAAYAHIDGGIFDPGYFTEKNAAAICDPPTISRDETNNRVIMSCATAGASIYYTTNGTTPTENNTRYTGPFTVSKNCTIKAIAVKDGYESSSVATYNVNWFKVATPTFSYSNLKLSISTTTEGATIYYTTDGSTPSTTNTKAQVYSSPISLSSSATVKAIAVKADYTNSDVATYNFVIDNYTCQAPQISRSGQTNSIIMTSATSGATIYYTTDGTTPTNGSARYSGPITVDHNQTIRAIAMKDGMFNSAQSQFTVDWFKVATPTFSYSNLQLTISTATTGATIYYTTNGSNPLEDLSRAIRYTNPIQLDANATIKAAAIKTDFNDSEIATYSFVKADYVCKQPQITRDGSSDRLMMSSTTENAIIYYTIDGSTPTTSSTRYTGAVTLAYNCTVRAIATHSDLFPSEVSEFTVNWMTDSDVIMAYSNGVLTLICTTFGAEIHYEIGGKDAMKSSPLYTGPITLTDNREVRYVVYATGQDPVSGSFTPNDFVCAPVTLSYDGLNIELATTEEGATIYYTTDGSLPTTSSETYRGKISLTGLCTVNAFATKQYKNNSEMMSEPITYFFDGTDVFLSEAGRLGDAVKREIEDIETLNVKCQGSGELNASDFSALRSIKSLKYLNLKDALFENNTVPDGAFANMNVVLIEFPPTETKISRITGNVFSGSNHLAAIVWMAPIKMAQSASALGITNPNLLIYVDNKSFAPQGVRNIVENGSASSIVLTDEGISFWCPQAFTAQRISYTHIYSQTTGINKCSGWETIALPFDVQNITHEDVGRITPFAANDASPRSFWLGELSESGFKRASEIKAYTPYIISMPNNEVYGNSYILAGMVTFEAYNTTVPVTEIKTTKKGTHVFTPCFDVVNAASSVYAINKYDQSNSYPEGSTFLPNYSDVKPFEAYIAVPTNGVAPRYIPIRDDSDTGIDYLTPDPFQNERVYDLTGRKVQGELKRGVYIINGNMVMVK